MAQILDGIAQVHFVGRGSFFFISLTGIPVFWIFVAGASLRIGLASGWGYRFAF